MLLLSRTGQCSSRAVGAGFPNRNNKLLTRPDKETLRAMLESQVQEKLQHNPEAVTTYAAKPEPERKPYTSKPTVQDKAFHKELEQMRADAEAGLVHAPKCKSEDGDAPSLRLDDSRVCKTCC